MQNNNRTGKKYSKNPNKVKVRLSGAKCIENMVLKQNTVNKMEENEPEQLNLQHKTHDTEVKKKKKNKNGDNHIQVMTATLVRH